MARRHIALGLDIGTHQVKAVIAERQRGGGLPEILGTGIAESRGLRHGYIVNGADVARSIKAALAQASAAAGVRPKRCYLSIGGVSLDEFRSSGEAAISRADSEITERDVGNALAASERAIPKQVLQNRKVVHSIPLSFRIDGEKVLGGSPVEMKGGKLSVETLFITCITQHLNDLVAAVESTGVEVEDVMVSPLAASLVTLSKTQKKAGCILANIGAETVSLVVFEDGIPISLKVFPIGSADITNDIALGLRIPLEEAENIKLGVYTSAMYSKKKLDDITTARLSDIFDLIAAHLKKIGKHELLPAGIILTGGGSGISSVSDLAKAALKLPSRVAYLTFNVGGKQQQKDSSWAVAYGLTIWGLSTEEEVGSGIKLPAKAGKSLLTFLQQFLP